MKFTLRTLSQILSVMVAIAALSCAIVGMLDYLRTLAKKKPYTEFPPEYDDYADWDVE